MKPLLISSGEPAGVGPDLCLELAYNELPLVIIGDISVLKDRANILKKEIRFNEYHPDKEIYSNPKELYVYHVDCPTKVIAGQINHENSAYVLKLLELSAKECEAGNFSALITAPVNKAVINRAGYSFSGHTEYFANYFNIKTVVMLLACSKLKVALMTTHLPLKEVANHITVGLIQEVIQILNTALIHDFHIIKPRIKVAGLNPHAGEAGYLGREEINMIIPALNQLTQQGLNIKGPLPADTLFLKEHLEDCDAFVAMYHDQGLPIIRHAYFNEAVNITLGLPIIRTSVDHGTAEHLAGKNLLNAGSMLAAVHTAHTMAKNRDSYAN